jgi:pyruvate carboxylase
MEKQTLNIDTTLYETGITKKYLLRKKYVPANPGHLLAVIPGVITAVFVKQGQKVHRGDSLLSLEAMKMINDVTSPRDGVIKAIHVETGKQVMKHELLLEFDT